MRSTVVFFGVFSAFASMIALAYAQTAAPASKYHVTPREKAACTDDAIRFCVHTYPDEDKLIACMRANRANLSPTCGVVFDEGLKRRHM